MPLILDIPCRLFDFRPTVVNAGSIVTIAGLLFHGWTVPCLLPLFAGHLPYMEVFNGVERKIISSSVGVEIFYKSSLLLQTFPILTV